MRLDDFVSILNSDFYISLPGHISHEKMLPRGRNLNIDPVKYTSLKLSSVLVLLLEENDEISVLLAQRQEYKGIHSGQIAFPGGKSEQSDSDRIFTALREANEEIGINMKDVSVISTLTELYIPPSNFLVLPVLGVSKSSLDLRLDDREVKEVFSISLEKLSDPKILEIREFKVKDFYTIQAPAYVVDDKIIWGATAMILTELLDLYKMFKS